MPEKAPVYRAPRKQDRFLPCLIARLVDDEPHNRVERNPQLFTMEQLKKNVLRNVTMILNSSPRRLESDFPCSETVRDSVLLAPPVPLEPRTTVCLVPLVLTYPNCPFSPIS